MFYRLLASLLAITVAFAFAPQTASAQVPDLPPFGEDKFLTSFDDAATFTTEMSPKKAKPGEEVTFTLTITPNFGCWTYPANPRVGQIGTNTFLLPKTGDVLFVQKFNDPDHHKVKKDGGDWYYPDAATWKFKAYVSPTATPGKKKIALDEGSRLQVCNTKNCVYFGNANPITAELEILPGPATPIPDNVMKEINPAPPAVVPKETPSADKPKTGDSPKKADEHASGYVKKNAIPPAEHDAKLKELLSNLQSKEVKREGGLLPLLLTGAAWGLISLVTPCVFPMIPITVSLFLKQSHNSTSGAVKLALIYCATIIVVLSTAAFTALGTFRAMSVHPIMNVALGILFIVLAMSLFGMFNLELPGFLLRYTEGKRKLGGAIGTVFGAIAFSIVSFTCVAPFLGGFAGMATSNQYSRPELFLAALSFASAFAAPFFVLAMFPSLIKALPKSGGWLDRIKAVMGFLEVAAALKFFRTAELLLTETPSFFTYDIVLAGWVVIMIACGLYLLNLYRMPHDEESGPVGVMQLFFALLFISLGVYLLPGSFKTANGQQRPSGVVYAWIDAFLLPESAASKGEELPWNSDLPAVIEKARKEKKLVFVDFTGVTCTNCKDNERNVFPLKEVDPLLRKYKLASMYTDTIPAEFYNVIPSSTDRVREATANLLFQREAFKTEQLPLYVIMEPLEKGARTLAVYTEGKINNREAFVEFLKKPLEAK